MLPIFCISLAVSVYTLHSKQQEADNVETEKREQTWEIYLP